MQKDSEKINELRSSISNLKDHLFISDLKKEIKEFVHQNIEIDESQSFLKVETITDIPSWFPRAKLSRTQADLIARSDDMLIITPLLFLAIISPKTLEHIKVPVRPTLISAFH